MQSVPVEAHCRSECLCDLAKPSPACVVCTGQSAMVTEPLVATAAAAKAAALDRSGSTWTSRPRGSPGSTIQRSGSGSLISTPASRRTSIVISTCARLGTVSAVLLSSMPKGMTGAASRSPETNWLEALASMPRWPPRSCESAWIVIGKVPSAEVIEAPSSRRDSIVTDIGRTLACSSPSSTTSRPVRAASGGMNRITVPARPQSMVIGVCSWTPVSAGAVPSVKGIGSMWSSSPSSSITAPRRRRASTMSRVSRLRSHPLRSEPDRARAARMR